MEVRSYASPGRTRRRDKEDETSTVASLASTSTLGAIKLSPLVSSCKHLLKPNGSIIGRNVARTILPLFPSMCSAIPADSGTGRAALGSIDGRRPISHARIRDFILSEFGNDLHGLGYGRGHRIAVVLPNGPELALSILAIANWASCVPLNAAGAKSELEADLRRCGADVVIGPYSGSHRNEPPSVVGPREPSDDRFAVLPAAADGKDSAEYMAYDHVRESAHRLGIPFIGLLPCKEEAGIFRLIPDENRSQTPSRNGPSTLDHRRTTIEADKSAGMSQHLINLMNSSSWGSDGEHTQPAPNQTEDIVSRFLPNSHSDEVLVLFTSGTTGNKKVVPHKLGDMLVAAATIALSWNLTPVDINCNLMPLFHVGGIVRQVFSPVLSGGCVICCPSFDPSIFWALLARRAFTWYYAAPTMHQLILQTGKQQIEGSTGNSTLSRETKPKLRMIANAAGGLLPSLARELRETFHANILPSYGMTECMPISSPPASYKLEKPGTSGVAVGPEIAIMDTSTMKHLPPGKEGPICVRGEPCFRGYGTNLADPSAPGNDTFLEGGWFCTGDLGYLDSDGYLYITGRSKEVINRGGEIISPMEVEEAVLSHPDVKACAAFSALHDVLQEVVGIVIVTNPGRPRLDLHTLHEYLGEERLAAPKWPQCIVFMDDLPKSHTNKLLRVKLGQRLGLPELNDGMYPVERTFQAKCPTKGTPLGMAIPSECVPVSASHVQAKLREHLLARNSEMQGEEQQLFVISHPSRIGALVCHVFNVNRLRAVQVAQEVLDRYLVPSHFVELQKRVSAYPLRELLPPTSHDAISSIIQSVLTPTDGPTNTLMKEMQELFMELLNLDCHPAPDTNFFNLGGSSMLASQLASKIRKRHNIPFSGAEVFHHASCKAMAAMIQERSSGVSAVGSNVASGSGAAGGSVGSNNGSSLDSSSVNSSKGTRSSCATASHFKNVDTQGSPFAAMMLAPEGGFLRGFFQLVPLFVVFPIFQVSRFFLFFSTLLMTLHHVPFERNLITFIITLALYHLVWVSVTPLIFVLIKWSVIGTYHSGRYPIYSFYYLRWWFVDVCRKLFGRGIWGSNQVTLNWYYRLLGAKIGNHAHISLDADVAEYDLVEVGDFASVEYSTLRAFGVDNGCMILGPVSVGNNASVGIRSVVAPYTSVADGNHLGPVSSSYEVGNAVDVKHASYNRHALPQPSLLIQVFVGGPITFFVDTCSHLPAMLVLYWMIKLPIRQDDDFSTMSDLMEWLCDVRRIPFYIGIRLARAIISPFVYMGIAIVVKWCIIGTFQPGPRDTDSQWQLMRHWLAESLFSRENMQNVTELLGRHYELVSCLFRLLGAKVGKRVFWPGHLPVFSGEFDLLEIGDDVVFGSRSVILCTTSTTCEKVVLCAGSNVADNCVVLPGSVIGKNAVLGSNSVCPAGWYLPEASVWFGSRGCEPVMLERGIDVVDADMPMGPTMASDVLHDKLHFEGDETTLRPFGKAFYKRDATYVVWPLSIIIILTVLTKIMVATIHTIPLLGALHGAAGLLYGFPVSEREYDATQYSTYTMYTAILVVFFFTHVLRVVLWLIIELTGKWTIMGQREEGRYNYDTSDYAQRWELYQLITRLRNFHRLNVLDFIAGTPFMSWFFRLNGCKVGEQCCLYPAGADPFMPEPDLVSIGKRCVIDCASIVCHLNTRGNFELARIVLEDCVTLRSWSRVQEGVHMETGSMILEKSLAMTGEVIEAGSVWQGAPALRMFQYALSSPSRSFGNDAEYEAIV